MRTPRSLSPRQRAEPDLAGWDIGLAAFALACMTAGFWRLWPSALPLTDAPLGPMILKAGLASLGFVALASRWEDVLRAVARNPLMLVLLALSVSSSIWAITPADALRNAILFIVIWVFGVGLTLRFHPRELSEICGFGGIFGLMAQFAAHRGMPPVSAFDGDIVFAIIGSAWAAWCVPVRRPFWLLAFGACCLLAFAAGDRASLGAIIGLVFGYGIAQLGAIRGRQGTVSIIVTAWVLVVLIIGVTLFALFGADPVSLALLNFFQGLGPHMMIGQGFGISGHSVSSGLGAGLGVIGLGLGGFVAFSTVFQALLNDHSRFKDNASYLDFNIVTWFGVLAAILVAPTDISLFGPVFILFAASAFSISLSCDLKQRPRRALIEERTNPKRALNHRTSPQPRVLLEPTLNEMGLRPKR
jgi:hypothetical protein